MKDINSYIIEANESKDKTFKQLRKGDKIYYLEMYNSDKNHKIEVCTVKEISYHEPWCMGGYNTSECWEIRINRTTKNKDTSIFLYKNNWDNKLYVSLSGFEGDKDRHPYHYISTDRELLNKFQEELIDEDIKVLEKDMEKLVIEYEGKRIKLQKQIDDLLQKKIEKYED